MLAFIQASKSLVLTCIPSFNNFSAYAYLASVQKSGTGVGIYSKAGFICGIPFPLYPPIAKGLKFSIPKFKVGG